jgi:KUP system potassium uptake protein
MDIHRSQPLPLLTLAALGIVYGDIGTSPLYAFRESIGGPFGAGTGPDAVIGVLSMIFWAVTLVVSVKYVLIVLRADNDGEGGVLALLAAVLRQFPLQARARPALVAAGLAGAAMFYGDAVITPAISVLAAVEGLHVIAPAAGSLVVPVSIGVLAALFSIQRFGTAAVGGVFGPVMLVWFAALAVLGAAQIAAHPQVLIALSPVHALQFVVHAPGLFFIVLAAVFLAVTGGEALYADMGHFGARPIRVAWFWIVMPALLLNYFGQGALLLRQPEAADNPFFLLAPTWLQPALVALATAATVIASQAVISGAFSLSSQAVKLGFVPRLAIRHTSAAGAGQIYVPLVNLLLFVCVVALVLGFGSSSALAAAYGLAVSTTMVLTTLGVIVVAVGRWGWSPLGVALSLAPLLALDLLFVAANTAKIAQGGWFTLALGGALLVLFTTWRRGRELMSAEQARGLDTDAFVRSLATHPPQRVEGTALFFTPAAATIPHALLHNLKHNRVLHERVFLLTIAPQNVPHMPEQDTLELRDLGGGMFHLRARLGFQDPFDIDHIARLLGRHLDVDLVPAETSFFLSRPTVVGGKSGGMAAWRKRLFAWMARSAHPASDFFRLPPNRTIEIGTQVVI